MALKGYLALSHSLYLSISVSLYLYISLSLSLSISLYLSLSLFHYISISIHLSSRLVPWPCATIIDCKGDGNASDRSDETVHTYTSCCSLFTRGRSTAVRDHAWLLHGDCSRWRQNGCGAHTKRSSNFWMEHGLNIVHVTQKMKCNSISLISIIGCF